MCYYADCYCIEVSHFTGYQPHCRLSKFLQTMANPYAWSPTVDRVTDDPFADDGREISFEFSPASGRGAGGHFPGGGAGMVATSSHGGHAEHGGNTQVHPPDIDRSPQPRPKHWKTMFPLSPTAQERIEQRERTPAHARKRTASAPTGRVASAASAGQRNTAERKLSPSQFADEWDELIEQQDAARVRKTPVQRDISKGGHSSGATSAGARSSADGWENIAARSTVSGLSLIHI